LLTTDTSFPRRRTIFSDRYLDAQALDADGYPVDPFVTGTSTIPSRTRGVEHERYEQW
jgi:hypothetical protein